MDYLQYTGEGVNSENKVVVLNLVINGLPSILMIHEIIHVAYNKSFKPCYKWTTFNTSWADFSAVKLVSLGFKPCYKWTTFNTEEWYVL